MLESIYLCRLVRVVSINKSVVDEDETICQNNYLFVDWHRVKN